MRLLLLLLLILSLMVGCGDGVAGGTGTETTNGFVALSDGTPAAGVTVALYDESQWIDKVNNGDFKPVEVTTTNSKGEYKFNTIVNDSGLTVRVVGDEEGALLRSGLADTITLSPYGELTGPVANGVSRVLISGMTDTAEVVDGKFTFKNLPQADYALLIEREDTLEIARTVSLKREYESASIQLPGGLMVDDFESGFQNPPLRNFVKDFTWYTFSDKEMKEFKDTGWIFTGSVDDSGSSLSSAKIENGLLRLDCELKAGAASPNAGIGASLVGVDGEGLDFSRMDGFFLRARGNEVHLKMTFKCEAPVAMPGLKDYEYFFSLTEAWVDIFVDKSHFHIEGDDGTLEAIYPWTLIGKKLEAIEISIEAENNDGHGDDGLGSYYAEFKDLIFKNVTLDDIRN